MPSVPQVIQERHHRRTHLHNRPVRRFGRTGLAISLILSLVLAFALVSLAAAYVSLTYQLPSPDLLPLLLEPPDGLLLQPTRIYDRTGQHVLLILENPAAAGHQYLALGSEVGSTGVQVDLRASPPSQPGRFAPALVIATLFASDPGFWNHPGFSFQGIAQGDHPTIAQRLVSDILLWNEPSGLRRALRERLLAAQVTVQFGRQKVLEWYLNSADYGRLNFGADAAARAYFGKSAADLDLAEAAVLAVTSLAPELNPIDAPQVVLDRQNQLLQAMLGRGLIDADEFRQVTQEKLQFKDTTEKVDPKLSSQTWIDQMSVAPAFTEVILAELAARYGPDRPRRGGLKVITSLDYDLQLQAACAATAQVARLEGSSEEEILTPDACQAARLLPTLPVSAQAALNLAANVVVLDPQTGQVLALVGESSPGLDPASLPGHPPGSLLTPFIYLTAFTRGFTPASLIWDVPGFLPDSLVDVTNPDGRFHGPMRLRIALANDYLVPAAQLLDKLGPGNVWHIARQVGLASLEPAGDPSSYRLPETGGEITLFEAVQAYGVFANQGLLVGVPSDVSGATVDTPNLLPVTVLQVSALSPDPGLNALLLPDQGPGWGQATSRPVISTQLAYLMTDVLSDEPARWPSLGHPNPLEIGRPAGAKIGRTLDGQDAWTVGYTSQLVVGVWLGKRATNGSYKVPPNAAAGLWHAILQYASRDQAVTNWTAPAGVSKLEVCDPSGELPTPDCPVVVTETFLDGSEPTQTDSLFRSFQINRETGLLATVFTPAQLIEPHVYMLVPPEAADWARAAGLPTPPEDYDLLVAPPAMAADARITSPEMFADVRGQVSIQGSANGQDFKFYRLQVGQGLNPQDWLQIGADVSKPVSNGLLAAWDTAGLDGLYAIQLLVVRQDQHIDTVTVQVTVDNTPPQVSIRYPADGAQIKYPQDGNLIFQVEASDQLNLAAVNFYVDSRPLTVLRTPPFVAPWQASLGRHTLRVSAVDRAGNTSVVYISFSVER